MKNRASYSKLWKMREKSGKVWYELLLSSKVTILQGTKSFNPLKEMEGKPVGLTQIHSSIIHQAQTDVKLVGDGLFTDKKGIIIYIKSADCLPIILYHPKKMVLAILHAGWKGTVLKIVKNSLLQMKENYNLRLTDWQVAFGPCIDMKNYNVGKEVYELFKKEGLSGIYIRNHLYFLDLEEANIKIIEEMGIKNFYSFPEKTYSSKNFYSHRKGEEGRNITAGKINP